MLMQYDMWFSNGDADDKTVLFLKVIFFLFQWLSDLVLLDFYSASVVYAIIVCLSVCLSVCNTPVLYQNG